MVKKFKNKVMFHWLNKNIKFNIILIALLFAIVKGYSQDLHFSQFYNTPFYVNPALTGESNSMARCMLNYKDQWSSITSNPFKTYTLFSDFSFYKERFSTGALILKDYSGDGNFGITQAGITLASKVQIDKNNFLRIGIEGLFSQLYIDMSKLSWNSQFDGTIINKELNSGEPNSQLNYKYLDISTGIIWISKFKKGTILKTGIAAFHASKPKYNLLVGTDNLNIRWSGYADVAFNMFENYVILNPSLLVEVQSPFREFNIGSTVKYDLNKKSGAINLTDVSVGLYYRNRDAIIIYSQFSYKNILKMGFSYDINISNLVLISKAKGGVELSILYTIPINIKAKKEKK